MKMKYEKQTFCLSYTLDLTKTELYKSCRRNSQETLYKRALSTGEPYTCEYVTLLQSFHRGTLSIQWYRAQDF